jgi:small-conductance mechanosensitive channel
MNTFFYLQKIIIPIAIVLGSFLLGFLFERQIVKRIRRVIRAKYSRWDNLILDSFRGISILWFFLGGIYLSLPFIPVNQTALIIIQKGLIAAFLMSFTIVTSRLSVKLLRLYTTRDDGVSPLTSLFEFLINVLIFSIGILIILQSIGVAITPLLTAFGVGGVSIGLALQSTLANLMSGINIITSNKVKLGDYIELKTGEAGYVADVELKYTIIQEITNNFLVIPNSKILSSSFRNFSLPNKEMLIPIEVRISYESDLEKVEAITLQVAKDLIQELTIGISEEEPFIRYGKFDYFSINLVVYLKIREQEHFDHLRVKHEFLKKIHKTYQEKEIQIPYSLPSAYIFENLSKLSPKKSENI